MQLKAPEPQKPLKGYFFFANSLHPRVKWWMDAHLRKLYFYCCILILSNVANGFDGSMINGLQSLPYWQIYFDHPKGSILGFFNASTSLGSIIGLPFIPPLLDRYGRKSGIVVGSLIVVLGLGLQSGALNLGMFVASRFLIGFGMVIATAAAPLLVAELSHSQNRAILCTFMGISYGIGSFIASWVTFGTLKISSNWAWRLPSIILCFIWFIPESPRWYISRDQPEKALEILAYHQVNGNSRDEFIQLEYLEIRTSFMIDDNVKNTTKYTDFLRAPGNRKRIGIIAALSLFSQWSGNGLVSYYLTVFMNSIGITEAEDQLGINGGLQSWGLIVALTFAFLIGMLGRRPMYLIGTIGTLVTFVVWSILSARYSIKDEPGLGKGVVAMIFCYNFFYNFKTGILSAYQIEILPYGLRAKGSVIASFVILVAVFFNQYINSLALDAIGWKYYLFYCSFLGFEVSVVWKYIVETRYTPMEEVAKYFVGDRADVVELTIAQKEKDDMEKEGKGEHMETV
ncbi:hypothetical protein N7481_011541 [Penicillium waksmanii]|uniref:uncharacterized protein n=1 Tax=Penicillium waksmanii TaxID=69791 RepID=UPI002547D6AB|nr:uncharacterized protein N7481_011541 [Penicillium waksmanii]KAJ5974331.1 hypothetical protein N7481_011541 [Penicillium waksmanii]